MDEGEDFRFVNPRRMRQPPRSARVSVPTWPPNYCYDGSLARQIESALDCSKALVVSWKCLGGFNIHPRLF